MSTSLAEQLQRIAAPQTDLLTSKSDKTKASLLFDAREAAGFKRETIYQIGLDGLEELVQRNQAFEQFKSTLFDITSKRFQRAVESAESNSKVDKKIRQLLLLCSPFFLLNSTHKVLEWLIRCYHVHEYNREDLLMLALPYHESNVFLRVVQLMKFKDSNDPWFFLKSLQKSNVPLTKSGLLNHAASSVAFIKFTGKFISSLIKEHQKPSLLYASFNFYCSVYAGAIEYSKELNEAQITQMLPSLLKGLSSDIADYCAASFVITARLLAKASLNDLILEKLVSKVIEVKVESLRKEATLLLLVLFQSQGDYKELSEQACLTVASKQWLPKILEDLNQKGCVIWPFLEATLRSSIRAGLKQNEEVCRNLVTSIMSAVKFDAPFVATFINVLLDSIKFNKKYPDHQTQWLTDIISTIERQYPEQFDKEVYKILSTAPEGKAKKRKKSLQKVFTDSMTVRGKFDVFDKLYHPNAQLRAQAIAHLRKSFSKLREAEKEMIKSSFVDRLNDEDVGVVKEALDLIKTVQILDEDNLKRILIKLTDKCQQDMTTWDPIASDVVLLLCSRGQSDDWQIFLAIFPFLLPNSDSELKRALQICKTTYIKENCLLKMNHKKLCTAKDCQAFCNAVFACLENDSTDIVAEFVQVLQKTPPENRTTLHKYVASLVLSNILPGNSPVDVNVFIVEIFVNYFETSEMKTGKINREVFLHKHVNSARKGKFSLEAFLLNLKNVVVKTEKLSSEIDLGREDLASATHFSRYFVLLAKVLFQDIPSYRKYRQMFLDYFCPDLRSKIEFILNLAVCGNELLDQNFPKRCLEIVLTYLADVDSDVTHFANIDCRIVPYLLVLLLQPSEELRKLVLQIMEILAQKASSGNPSNFVVLLEGLLQQKEEIFLDCNQVPLVIFNVLPQNSHKSRRSDSHAAENMTSALVNTACSAASPLYLKAGLLTVLSQINTFEMFEKISQLGLDILHQSDNTKTLDPVKSSILLNNIVRCEPSIAPAIKLTSNAWSFMEKCFKNDKLEVVRQQSVTYPAVFLLKQLGNEFFTNLPTDVESRCLDVIIETATLTRNPEVLPTANRVFKHIDMKAELITEHLTRMRDVQSPKVDPAKLKRRRSVVPTVDILDTLPWRKGITVLEYIQNKKKIRDRDRLLPILFDILKRCLEFDEQVVVEYPKQLVLSAILQFCEKLEKTDLEQLPETIFNMESVVQCIRASQNPQTHHHALLVLARAATLVPNQVLHHIMAIFTFMGSSVLRHDDAYSYQIITKIIDSTIPILTEDDSPKNIAKVLRVFVSALLDVPVHRRLPLYKQLLSTIGVRDNLHVFLLLVFESHVFHNADKLSQQTKPRGSNAGATGSTAADEGSSSTTKRRLEIAAELCNEFSVEEEIGCCINLMKHLKELPDERFDDKIPALVRYDINFTTPKQFRHYRYTLLQFITNLLSSKEFVTNKVATLRDERLLSLEPLHKDMILCTLTYVQRISKVVDHNVNTPQHNYWKVMLHLTYDILDSVNALLTPQMFLLVVKGLLQHNLGTVRRRTLELLNSKLQTDPRIFDGEENEVLSLIPLIIGIIRKIDQQDPEPLDSDEEVIIQTALLSLKLVVKLLASQHKQKFVEITEFLTQITRSGKAQNNVLASVVLCLAELCSQLGAHFIQSLPELMPILLKITRRQKSSDKPSLLLLSAVTALSKIVDTVALFLSPFLEKMLTELSVLMYKWGNSKEPISVKLLAIKAKIGATIPLRVLLPAVQQTWDYLLRKQNFGAIGALLEILSENLQQLQGTDLTDNLPTLTEFFIRALDFRADQQQFTMDQSDLVESQVIRAMTVLVLKLSESKFRPLYYELYEWAVNDINKKPERVITFYSLTNSIANSLKGLFALFAGHIVGNVASILDGCNTIKNDMGSLYFDDQDKNLLLLDNVLKTLLAVFTYDSHKFVTKDRFDKLMQPIVDQLENTLGGIPSLKERNANLLTPCIVQFAVATADDSLWKQMNYQILLKLRHTSAHVRLIGLEALTETVKKLGEDFLPLLPETIPFLSELLEDEDESVEKACRTSIQQMEKILGEPLQKYF